MIEKWFKKKKIKKMIEKWLKKIDKKMIKPYVFAFCCQND